MRKGGVDWQFISYGNAAHSFTNKEAGTDNSKGTAYNEKADKRSWEAMKTFLRKFSNRTDYMNRFSLREEIGRAHV